MKPIFEAIQAGLLAIAIAAAIVVAALHALGALVP